MAFLIHLVLIVGGLFGLLLLFAKPKTTVFWVIFLGLGYVGSTEGFLGTVIGLLIGAAIGGLVAAIVFGLQEAWRAVFAPKEKASPTEPAAKVETL